jgi:glucose/arabinose dehydrogenase
MRLPDPFKTLLSIVATLGALCAVSPSASAQHPRSGPAAPTGAPACPRDDSGLKLPAGFCATIFADGIGHARHMVAAPNGVVYVNTWSGRYYGNDPIDVRCARLTNHRPPVFHRRLCWQCESRLPSPSR